METNLKTRIPYKSNEDRQSTHILVRLTESQKETIKLLVSILEHWQPREQRENNFAILLMPRKSM